MSATILEERGYFWWDDHDLPEDQLIPNSSIVGLLRINEQGRIELELDGVISGVNNVPTIFTGVDIKDRCIRGLLIKESMQVQLFGIIINGGSLMGGGVSNEKYIAEICLIGDSKPTLKFKLLNIELHNLNDWFRLQSITCKRTRNNITITHKRKKGIYYKMTDSAVTIRHNIYGPQIGTYSLDNLSLRESVSITYKTSKNKSIEEMIALHKLLEDFFMILTDIGSGLEWPKVALTRNSPQFTCYYSRGKKPIEKFEWRRSPTNFIQIKDNFGSLLDCWKIKNDTYGPAINLYLGTRGGKDLYVEHRFVNLIWGLESLHRRKNSDFKSATPLVAKVNRILDCISSKDDKKWLSKKLEHAGEPSLAERIRAVLESLELDFDQNNLRAFSDKCAMFRNDISHYGELRHGSSYKENILEIHKINQLLIKLYHAILLKEIGITGDILKAWISNNHEISTYLITFGFTIKHD